MNGTNWILFCTLLITNVDQRIIDVTSNGVATEVTRTVIERRSGWIAASLESITQTTNDHVLVMISPKPGPVYGTSPSKATNFATIINTNQTKARK